MAPRAVAEAIGTAFLLAAVVGSGIMGDRLSGGKVANRATRQHRHEPFCPARAVTGWRILSANCSVLG